MEKILLLENLSSATVTCEKPGEGL